MRPPAFLIPVLALLLTPTLGLAQPFTWNGGTGNWSSATNWSPSGVPNGAGVAIQYSGSTSTTTQDLAGGVTVGSITFGGASNATWNVVPGSNGITLNGNGTAATIANTNTNTGSSNALAIGSTTQPQTITLASDLRVTNSSNSTNANGGVRIQGTIGGNGNVTFNNASTTLSATNSIRLLTGTNTFTGSVLVQRGTVTFNQSSSFGASANVITLGEAGAGSAALLTTGGVTVANNIVVAAGTGGVTTLGGLSASATTYSGNILLNGNLTLLTNSDPPLRYTFSGLISGVGGLTHQAAFGPAAPGVGRLTNTNTYTGSTLISSGTLQLDGGGSINNTPSITLFAGSTFDVAGVTGGYTLGTATAQTLQGSGRVTGAVTVANNGTIRGGNGVNTGTLTVSNVTVNSGGTLAATLAASGSNSTLAFAGNTLDLKTGSILRLDDLAGFGYGTFNLATFTNGNSLLLDGVATTDGELLGRYIVGEGASEEVVIDVSQLPTLAAGDRLELRRTGNNLVLTFSPVPEPATLLAACGLVVGGVAAARRRRKRGDVTPAA
jgi:fibronectin-binding autotransporter adhesin